MAGDGGVAGEVFLRRLVVVLAALGVAEAVRRRLAVVVGRRLAVVVGRGGVAVAVEVQSEERQWRHVLPEPEESSPSPHQACRWP